MKLTLAEAAIGAGAMLEVPAGISNAGTLISTGCSIDSRTVGKGDLFFAVRGARFDGHDFLTSAFAQGAVAAVVSRARLASLPDEVLSHPLLVAEDPLTALQLLANHVRRQWGKRVVAVTGSAGKTTTKEAIAAALSPRFNVLKSAGNLNNNYGVPLQLLRLEPEHEIAIIEMGMNHEGEIAALARIAAPDWGVITNVGTAHIENFSDGQCGIAHAKFELVAALPATGTNHDKQLQRDFAAHRGNQSRTGRQSTFEQVTAQLDPLRSTTFGSQRRVNRVNANFNRHKNLQGPGLLREPGPYGKPKNAAAVAFEARVLAKAYAPAADRQNHLPSSLPHAARATAAKGRQRNGAGLEGVMQGELQMPLLRANRVQLRNLSKG